MLLVKRSIISGLDINQTKYFSEIIKQTSLYAFASIYPFVCIVVSVAEKSHPSSKHLTLTNVIVLQKTNANAGLFPKELSLFCSSHTEAIRMQAHFLNRGSATCKCNNTSRIQKQLQNLNKGNHCLRLLGWQIKT